MSKRAVRVLAVCTLVLAATVRGAAGRGGGAPTGAQGRGRGPGVCNGGRGCPEGGGGGVLGPFYRRAGSVQGAGLGLALVRQIARRHGGEARCEGNCFVVRLGAT